MRKSVKTAKTTMTSINREVSVFRGVSMEKVLYSITVGCKGRSWSNHTVEKLFKFFVIGAVEALLTNAVS